MINKYLFFIIFLLCLIVSTELLFLSTQIKSGSKTPVSLAQSTPTIGFKVIDNQIYQSRDLFFSQMVNDNPADHYIIHIRGGKITKTQQENIKGIPILSINILFENGETTTFRYPEKQPSASHSHYYNASKGNITATDLLQLKKNDQFVVVTYQRFPKPTEKQDGIINVKENIYFGDETVKKISETFN